jgi:Na+/H+-translocating membrane pyrophosphatase
MKKRLLALSIVIMLALSCAGVGLGMTGHVMAMDMGDSQMDMSAHACCTIAQSNSEQPGKIMAAFHDAGTAMGAQTVQLFTLLLLVLASTYTCQKNQLYYRKWQLPSLMKFLATSPPGNWLSQLFRIGILHPKSW